MANKRKEKTKHKNEYIGIPDINNKFAATINLQNTRVTESTVEDLVKPPSYFENPNT